MQVLEEDSIAALATPWGTSALALIRVSGYRSVHTVAKLCPANQAILNSNGYSLHHCRLYDSPDCSELLDDVVLSVFKSPRSFTGEDMVEISCHGSQAGIERILQALYALGIRPANPGEFSRRAFVNGKLDLTRAEAIHDIVSSHTRTAHRLAMRRLEGSIEERVDVIKRALVQVMAKVSVQLDYAEDELEEIVISTQPVLDAIQQLQSLTASYSRGKLYQEGITVVLAGATNAGKSSLFNNLLKENRAIVSDIPGTTRDYIEARLQIADIPVKLIDTAGFRTSSEIVEQEGMRRSEQLLESADFVLYLIDSSLVDPSFELEHYNKLKHQGRPILLVASKADNPWVWQHPEALALSALDGSGVDQLIERLIGPLRKAADAEGGDAVLASLRQKGLLEAAIGYLVEFCRLLSQNEVLDAAAMELQAALQCLGQISGEVSSEDLLDVIFSGFCLGK